MPKVLFYCQHLLGIGHLSRSFAIVNALLEAGCEVDFVQGGPDIGRVPSSDSRFRLIQLTPLLMHEETSVLYDPSGNQSVETIFAARRERLEDLCKQNHYDTVVTELFPFGRGKFKDEVLFLLGAVRLGNRSASRICSVRDILVGKDDGGKFESKVVKLVRENYDRVLVHSDPQVVRFEETFHAAAEISNLMAYTGFVCEKPVRAARDAERKNQVLVSLGGGAVGDEVALAVAEVASEFPELQFRFLLGPYAAPSLRSALSRKSDSNVRLESFLSVEEFEMELTRSRLSISLAGYNTLMNLLSTRTPALVFPYDRNNEQRMRAERLESLDLLKVLSREDLNLASLTQLIREALSQSAPAVTAQVRLDGAAESARLIIESAAANRNSFQAEVLHVELN